MSCKQLGHANCGSFHNRSVSLGELWAEMNIGIRSCTAILMGPIEFCLLDLHQADGDCHDEPTYDIIMSMTSL